MSFGKVCLAVAVVIGIDFALVDDFISVVFKMAHREDAEVIHEITAVVIAAHRVIGLYMVEPGICEVSVAVGVRKDKVKVLVIYRGLVTLADAPILEIARDVNVVALVGEDESAVAVNKTILLVVDRGNDEISAMEDVAVGTAVPLHTVVDDDLASAVDELDLAVFFDSCHAARENPRVLVAGRNDNLATVLVEVTTQLAVGVADERVALQRLVDPGNIFDEFLARSFVHDVSTITLGVGDEVDVVSNAIARRCHEMLIELISANLGVDMLDVVVGEENHCDGGAGGKGTPDVLGILAFALEAKEAEEADNVLADGGDFTV